MMKLKKFVSNVLWIAVFLGLLAVGFKFYKMWEGSVSVGSPMSNFDEVKKTSSADHLMVTNGDKGVSQVALPKNDPRGGKADDAKKQAEENFEAVKNRFIGCKVSYWGKLPKNVFPTKV